MDSRIKEVILSLGELIEHKNNQLDGLEFTIKYLREDKAKLEAELAKMTEEIIRLKEELYK